MIRKYAVAIIRTYTITSPLCCFARLTKTNVEANRFQTCAGRFGWVLVCAVRVIERLKSGTITEPEGTEGGEDDEGERVAKYPLRSISLARTQTHG